MKAAGVGVALLGVLASGCVDNVAPGNDREAGLEPPAAPAEVAAAATALAGVATELLQPEIMTDADLGAAPDVGGSCLFRFTEVGFPAVAYGTSAVLKLNGKLVPLPGAGDGRYSDAGIDVTVRPIEESASAGAQFPAEFVLRLPDAPNELGFHGFASCG